MERGKKSLWKSFEERHAGRKTSLKGIRPGMD
jgi:hypothetical protein